MLFDNLNQLLVLSDTRGNLLWGGTIMSENDKTKKARRQWLYYNESNELKTKEIGFNLDQLTLDAKL